MRSAGFKFGTEVFQSLVSAVANFASYKSLVDLPFKLFKAGHDLFEAERKAPGRELAYIIKAEQTFPGVA